MFSKAMQQCALVQMTNWVFSFEVHVAYCHQHARIVAEVTKILQGIVIQATQTIVYIGLHVCTWLKVRI